MISKRFRTTAHSSSLLVVAMIMIAFLRVVDAQTAIAPCTPTNIDEAACREARTLVAAERLNVLTERGILVSTISTAALIITVLLTGIATRAAIVAANAARQAVDQGRIAADYEFRPNLVVIPGVTTYHDEFDRTKTLGYGAGLRWKNIGKTPAMQCSYFAAFHWQNSALSDDYDFPTSGEVFHVGVLSQDDQLTVTLPTFPIDLLSKSFNGEVIIILYGWAEYSSFNSDKRHRTEYAALIDVVADPVSGADGILKPVIIDRFNGMDDTCLRRPKPFSLDRRIIAPRSNARSSEDRTIN